LTTKKTPYKKIAGDTENTRLTNDNGRLIFAAKTVAKF
jgi:hypothetical protein